MANWFEDLTKQMADEKMGRRTAMRRVAGTVAGVALASVIPGAALAKNKACPIGGNCSIPFTNCQGNPNTNCYCFTDSNGKGRCGCNGYCDGIYSCVKNTDCGRGSFCAYGTGCCCNCGWCLVKCAGKNKNCVLGSGQGATAAR